jgi:hypothetical protein
VGSLLPSRQGHFDLKAWPAPGFYGWGPGFPSQASQRRDGRGLKCHKGLAVLPCAFLGQGGGKGVAGGAEGWG